jgi:hypothetical protein
VACSKALNRALEREPHLLTHRLRQLVNHRSEQLFLACQAAIQREDVKAVLAAIRTLELQASINGLKVTKSQDLPVPPVEKPVDDKLAVQAIIPGFYAAFEVLFESVAEPRYEGLSRKVLDVTPIEPDPKDDQQQPPKKKFE